MIHIRPDPGHPHGGYAEITLPADKAPGDTVEVAVFDNYSERYLGDEGWQATRDAFGPYTVQRDGANARLVIGPEIVNRIEEYANVRLEVGDAAQDIGWPEEIVPAPGAARIGGILSARTTERDTGPALAVRLDDPQPEDAPAEPAPSEPASTENEAGADTADSPGGPRETPDVTAPAGGNGPGGRWLWLAALLLVAAGGVGWYLMQDRSEPTAETTPPDPEEPIQTASPEPETAPAPCSLELLQAVSGFADQAAALRECGGEVSPDTALTILEGAAADGDADALLLFGEIYDADTTRPVIEGTIGLTFSDNPATAADYYSRAAEAGSAQAHDRLSTLCERLEGMSDTLARGAFNDHCGS
jgi:hypothetical protein